MLDDVRAAYADLYETMAATDEALAVHSARDVAARRAEPSEGTMALLERRRRALDAFGEAQRLSREAGTRPVQVDPFRIQQRSRKVGA